jgi:malonyl-CoA decarboxylase
MPAVSWLERLRDTVADRGRELLGLRDGDERDALPELCRRLVEGRGEATNIALAREILQRYDALDEQAKTNFLLVLAEQFGPDPEHVQAAVAAFDNTKPESLEALLAAVEPPRQELFRRLNMAPAGTRGLVGMRTDLLARLREHPQLLSVDADFRHLLASWFNRGFLHLERIDWQSPAGLLDKIMRYESVHPVKDWDDLRRRLAEDRRCFGFFHPALPDEPLIFVEIALTREIATEIQPLLDPASEVIDPGDADTAMFYSINNALDGLRGISFGNFLLKQVLGELAAEMPRLKHYVTLSPLPRFAERLDLLLAGGIEEWSVERVDALLSDLAPTLTKPVATDSPSAALRQLLATRDSAFEPLLRAPLARLALLYITALKRSPGVCCDPVAAFHLANGAVLERINVFADRSDKGMGQSHGVMVNYRYDPEQVVANHEAFVQEGRIVMSRSLQREFDRYVGA